MKNMVAVFDFDGTLSKGECGLRYFRFVLGRRNFFFFCFRLAWPLIFYRFNIHDERMLERITFRFVMGKKERKLRQISEDFAEKVMPDYINTNILRRLQWHQQKGHRCIIASRSYALYLKPWARQLAIDDVVATELEVGRNGRFTGAMIDGSCRREEKVKRLQVLLGNRDNFCIYAYADSKDDHTLLKYADYPFWVKGAEYTVVEVDSRSSTS